MKQILYKLFEHQYLGRDEARTILQNIAQGKYNDVQVASLITVFLMRNISVEEPEVTEKTHSIFLQLPALQLPEPASRL